MISKVNGRKTINSLFRFNLTSWLCKRNNSKNTTVNHKVTSEYDCIVLGLGAHGSSTLFHLAKHYGSRVLGLEQFKVSHSLGSSHGLSRIIRLSYFEHPAYVAMLRRAFVLWDELEKESVEKLFTRTGSLDIGKKDSRIFAGSKLTCEQEKLDHTILTQNQLKSRFPGWQDLPDEANLCAVYQPDGGFLHPERCVLAHVNLARSKYGADVHENEKVLDIEFFDGNRQVLVKTNRGEYLTPKLVLSAGPWLGNFIQNSASLSQIKSLENIAKLLQPQRNVVTWYKSQHPEFYAVNNFPVFVLNYNENFFYGFPVDSKYGFKIGKYHHRGENLNIEMLNQIEAKWRMHFDAEDERVVGDAVKSLMPKAYGKVTKQTACVFTNTPDEHFIIDTRPDPVYPCVAVVSACSGHGFKFASVIGEIMATLIKRESNPNEISFKYEYADVEWLRANRFSHF